MSAFRSMAVNYPKAQTQQSAAPDTFETSRERLTKRNVRCHELPASEAPRPGRLHVGILGAIKSECPGDFVGIRRNSIANASSDGINVSNEASLNTTISQTTVMANTSTSNVRDEGFLA